MAIWKCSFCDLQLAPRTYFSPNLWLVSQFLTQALDIWYLAWLLVFGCHITSCPRLGFWFQILALTAYCSLPLKSYLCFWNFPLGSLTVLLTFLSQPLRKWVKTLVIRTALWCSVLNASFLSGVIKLRTQSRLDTPPGTLHSYSAWVVTWLPLCSRLPVRMAPGLCADGWVPIGRASAPGGHRKSALWLHVPGNKTSGSLINPSIPFARNLLLRHQPVNWLIWANVSE